jgi:hypothetical protein
MMPRTKSGLVSNTTGNNRVQELIDLTNEHSNFLPPNIDLRDLDSEFINFVKNTHLKIYTADKKEVPVFFLVKEKWAEFSMTWKYTDDTGNIVMPFITIRREAPKRGTNDNINYRISQNKKFNYLTIPTYDNGVHGSTTYKIPQPVAVDLNYEVRLFTHYMADLNSMNQLVHKTFASGQAYTNVKGYYMPIMLDSISDESTLNNYEGQRFYCQVYNINLLGFLQDKKDFEEVRNLRRVVLTADVKTNLNFENAG